MNPIFIQHVPYYGLAILTLYLTFWIAKHGSLLVEAGWARSANHRATAKFLRRFTYSATLVIGLTVTLKIAGFDATIFVGALALAAGFALKSWFGNLVAGIIIVTSKLLEVKAFVGTADGSGSVLGIDAMLTTLKTPTNQTIKISNSSVVGSPITVYGFYPEKLVKLEAWAGRETDPALVLQVMQTFVEKQEALVTHPDAPLYLLTDFVGGVQSFEARFWVAKTKVKNFFVYKKRVQHELIETLEEAGIEIPYDVMTLHTNVHDSGQLAVERA